MSASFTLEDARRWTGGTLDGGTGGLGVEGVSIDSRSVAPGELFVAIRGPRHDGHGFVAAAADRGAVAACVDSRGARAARDAAPALPLLVVDDTTRALGQLAAGHRARFTGPVIAITGSNGKTTTKEMCAAILAEQGPFLKTEGNLNNLYGLPLTLLRRRESHRTLVVELGTNAPGEIAALAEIARPTIGVVTNVGTAHAERLGSREGIAREKGALVEALAPEGVAVLNADDPRVAAMASRTRARMVRFGRKADADVRAENVTSLGPRGFAFDIATPEGRTAVHLAGLAEELVSDALAAAAAALAAGARLADVGEGLSRWRPLGGRLEQVSLPRNVIVINDTYNANPQSMGVALRSLVELKGGSRGVAVLGEMAELGADAAAAHRAIGRLAGELGVDLLFALGEHADEIAAGAREAGLAPERVHVAKDREQLARDVRATLRGDDWVLVKGSRSMRMEQVVQALAAEDA